MLKHAHMCDFIHAQLLACKAGCVRCSKDGKGKGKEDRNDDLTVVIKGPSACHMW